MIGTYWGGNHNVTWVDRRSSLQTLCHWRVAAEYRKDGGLTVQVLGECARWQQ